MTVYIPQRSMGQRRAGAFFCFFLGALVLGAAIHLELINQQFKNPLHRVMGTVDKLYVSSGRHTSSLMVGYHYQAGGASYRETVQASESTWSNLRVGKPLPIKYVANNPAISRIDLAREDKLQGSIIRIPFIMSAIFLGAGCWCYLSPKGKNFDA